MKVGHLAVETLSPETLAAGLSATAEPWNKKHRISAGVISETKAELSRLFVSQVFSAIDVLYDTWAADLESCLTVGLRMPAATQKPAASDDGDFDVQRIHALGFDTGQAASLLPSLRILRVLRNCIVHRDSMPSPDLIEAVANDGWSRALGTLPNPRGAAFPQAPLVRAKSRVVILPRHGILTSHVGLLLARELDRQFVSRLGEVGLTYLAARHFVLKRVPERHTCVSSLLDRIRSALYTDFTIEVENTAIRKHLIELGIHEKAKQRFRAEFGHK